MKIFLTLLLVALSLDIANCHPKRRPFKKQNQPLQKQVLGTVVSGPKGGASIQFSEKAPKKETVNTVKVHQEKIAAQCSIEHQSRHQSEEQSPVEPAVETQLLAAISTQAIPLPISKQQSSEDSIEVLEQEDKSHSRHTSCSQDSVEVLVEEERAYSRHSSFSESSSIIAIKVHCESSEGSSYAALTKYPWDCSDSEEPIFNLPSKTSSPIHFQADHFGDTGDKGYTVQFMNSFSEMGKDQSHGESFEHLDEAEDFVIL